MMISILLKMTKVAIAMGMNIAVAFMAFGTIFVIAKGAKKTIGACA